MAQGALMQLVAYGAQDVYLTGNPQITFFKVVYKRHTNFAIESQNQLLSGTTALGSKAECEISRQGDLIGPVYVAATITTTAANIVNNRIGFNILKYVELQIGGSRIDRQSNNWMLVWTNLTNSLNKNILLDSMVGGQMNLRDDTLKGQQVASAAADHELMIPLQFSFCRNPGLALPLIALQYHDVKIVLKFETASNCTITPATNAGNLTLKNASLWVDYIYLDSDERTKFAQESHEYLIEQVQETEVTVTASSNSNPIDLAFNHPIKELIWFGRRSTSTMTTGDTFTNFTNCATTNGDGDTLSGALLKLNNIERFDQMDLKEESAVDNPSKFFNCVQPYNYHTGSPLRGLNVYSFALEPEDHQPSGTCNFSRIDNAKLSVKTPVGMDKVVVMAHNYNVLRIMSGMGGLAYSN